MRMQKRRIVLEMCPVAGFDINGVAASGFATGGLRSVPDLSVSISQ